MHVRALASAVLLSWLVALAPAQAPGARPLTHDDYDGWSSLRGTTMSPDGAWVAYVVEPQWGDGVLEVRQTAGDVVHRHQLASGPRFSSDSRYVLFTIPKSKVKERDERMKELIEKGRIGAARPEGGEGEEAGGEPRRGPGGPGRGRGRGGRPGGGRGDLGILDLATGKVEVVAKVKGFRLLEDEPIAIIHLDDADKEGEGEAKTEPEAEGEAKPEPKGEGEAKPEPKAEGEARPEPKAEAKTEPQGGTPPAAAAGARERRGEGRQGGRRGSGSGRARRAAGGSGASAGGAENARTSGDNDARRRRAEGTPLLIRDLRDGSERRIEKAAAYGVSRHDRWLWVHVSTKEDAAGLELGLFAVDPRTHARTTVLAGVAEFSDVTSSDDGTALAFASNKEDVAAKRPAFDLYLWRGGEEAAERIVHRGTPGMPAGKLVARSGVGFSRDGGVVTFAVQDPPEGDPPPVLPEEKVALDLWHWRDGMLQTHQAKQVGSLRNPALSCVWHRDGARMVVLGTETAPRARLITPDGSRAVVTDDSPYEQLVTWDSRHYDVYLVNTIDGTRSKVAEKLRNSPTNSPDGRWLLWFDTDYVWYALDVQTLARHDLTGKLPVAFHRDDDDHPHPDPAHGLAGWTAGDAEAVLYDEFDLWRISPATGQAVCITDGYGRANHLRLRWQRMFDADDEDEERRHVPDEVWLTAVDTETMAEGIFVDRLDAVGAPRKLLLLDKNIGDLAKARRADRLLFTVQSFAEFPDVWTAAMDFSGMRKLSDANPQQRGIRWGTAELVRWRSADGVPLKGVLVKPDGFDPTRKYPLMVYFYERLSQNLHRYVAPSPGTSPNAAYYVSNGYLWFTPDIVYREGYPGESCVKCVVSGVQHLLERGYVDEHGIGAAGHSWGGYQTAFLVTRTDIFTAVESGAPVSNMISAYGGIRYSTGLSRQFQYEQTQSRIGGTPWEYPMRYWENSPIFFADKVHTPVLILHNDNDGAVPWTQGIEYFTALRRLGKESYLFNYVGEDHGLRKRPNQMDWTRRVAEYFDHHLRGAPMPRWMREGVRYVERDDEKLPHIRSYVEATAAQEEAQAAEAASSSSSGSR